MLTNPNKAASAAIQKQIVVQAVANQAIYTVPTGKTFVGNAFNAGSMQLSINGIQIVGSAGSTPASVPLTLVAGTVVSSGASYTSWSLVGVEQ